MTSTYARVINPTKPLQGSLDLRKLEQYGLHPPQNPKDCAATLSPQLRACIFETPPRLVLLVLQMLRWWRCHIKLTTRKPCLYTCGMQMNANVHVLYKMSVTSSHMPRACIYLSTHRPRLHGLPPCIIASFSQSREPAKPLEIHRDGNDNQGVRTQHSTHLLRSSDIEAKPFFVTWATPHTLSFDLDYTKKERSSPGHAPPLAHILDTCRHTPFVALTPSFLNPKFLSW